MLSPSGRIPGIKGLRGRKKDADMAILFSMSKNNNRRERGLTSLMVKRKVRSELTALREALSLTLIALTTS